MSSLQVFSITLSAFAVVVSGIGLWLAHKACVAARAALTAAENAAKRAQEQLEWAAHWEEVEKFPKKWWDGQFFKEKTDNPLT